MSDFFTAGSAAMTSLKDDWETPQALFEELDAVYHFTLDPCSTHENAKCEKHYTVVDDGLSKSWAGEVVFCNPPYGRNIGEWVRKCAEESKHAKIVMLIPARTDTAYFHDYIYGKAHITFIRGRLKFERGGAVFEHSPVPVDDRGVRMIGGTHDRVLPRRLHRRRVRVVHRHVHRDWRFGMSDVSDIKAELLVLKAENAKLRELVLHMHTCLEHYEPGDTISCKQCPYDNETWGCDYERLMAKLGIEVDA